MSTEPTSAADPNPAPGPGTSAAGTPVAGGRLTAALACAALFLGSFGDEAAQVTFALNLAGEASLAAISALLVSGLVGGVVASPCAPPLLARMRQRTLVVGVFALQCVVIALAASADGFAGYVAAAFVLGLLGSLLWSAVMVLIPSLARTDEGLARTNRAVQTVRNLGYVVGPALGGVLYAGTSGTGALAWIAGLLLLAAVVAGIALRRLDAGRDAPDTAAQDAKGGERPRAVLSLPGLLRLPGMVRALAPLVVTVLTTSMLNVVLILFVREELGYGAEDYGFLIGTLSVGLVLGPLLLAKRFERFGEPTGAALAAALIGGALVAMSTGAGFWWLAVAALVAGLANGVQNTLMATFVMKAVPADRRTQYMPAYVLILQSCVLTGFLTAGLFRVEQSAAVLFTAGCVACAAGLAGALANRGVRAPSTVERDEEVHVARD